MTACNGRLSARCVAGVRGSGHRPGHNAPRVESSRWRIGAYTAAVVLSHGLLDAFIQDYMRQVDAAIFGPQFANPSTGYAAFIDVESAISYYILNELFKNVDGNLRLSTYLLKKRRGLLTFGPVWDFDLAIGNVNYLDADRVNGWYIRTAAWFDRLFQDPVFANRVKQRWQQLVSDGTLNRLDQYILYRKTWLSTVQERNFNRWPILNTWVWPNRAVTGSYDGEVLALRDWLGGRRAWLDVQPLSIGDREAR